MTSRPDMPVTPCNMPYVKAPWAKRRSVSFRAARHVLRLHLAGLTWREIAARIGAKSPAYWQLVAEGERRISRAAEDALRRRLHMPPKFFRRIERMPVDVLARLIRERSVTHGSE
jgi:hypothetical protein